MAWMSFFKLGDICKPAHESHYHLERLVSGLIVHHKIKPDFRHLSSDGDSLEKPFAEKRRYELCTARGRSILLESVLLESLPRDSLLKSADEAKPCSISTYSLFHSLLFAN